MSEPGLSNENEQGGGRRHGREDEQPIRYSDFFRFWPIAFVEHIRDRAGRRRTNNEERDYYAQAIRKSMLTLCGILLVEVAVLLPAWLLGAENLDDWIIAAFTIAMAITTGLQWSAMKQGMQQTQQSIEFTRLQLLPDIVITNVTSAVLQANQGMSLRFSIENHGGSVASVYGCQIIPVFGGYLASQIQRDAMIKYAFSEKGWRDIRVRISPGCPYHAVFNAIQPVEKEEELTYERVAEIVDGKLRLYFVIAIFFDSAISVGGIYACTCQYHEHLNTASVGVLTSEATHGKPRMDN